MALLPAGTTVTPMLVFRKVSVSVSPSIPDELAVRLLNFVERGTEHRSGDTTSGTVGKIRCQ